jgi:uncharacterized membrane protein YwzB
MIYKLGFVKIIGMDTSVYIIGNIIFIGLLYWAVKDNIK